MDILHTELCEQRDMTHCNFHNRPNCINRAGYLRLIAYASLIDSNTLVSALIQLIAYTTKLFN